MFLTTLYIAFLAVIFAAILTGPAGWRHPRSSSAVGGVLFLFILFTIGMLAAVGWVGPMGPVWMDVHWLVPSVTGLLLIFLVLALAEPPLRRRDWKSPVEPDQETARKADTLTAVFGVFFWVLLLSLLLLAIFGAT